MRTYIKQFERAKRYLERVKQIYEGIYLPSSSEQCEDEVVSFFIHCYHVRDWILAHSNIKITRAEIDAFINKHDELKVCADLCNGEKHCRLERNKRSGGQPHLANSEYQVTHYTPASKMLSTYKASYRIFAQKQDYDALEIAEKCIKLWEEYILQIQ